MPKHRASREELLAQYEQAREDLRDYNRSVWQTPSVALAVESAVFTLAFGQTFGLTPAGRFGLLLTGTLTVIGLLVTFVKHSHYQALRALSAQELASRLGLIEEPLFRVTWSKELKEREQQARPKHIQGALAGQSAVTWLARILYFVVVFNVLLLAQAALACLCPAASP